MFVSRSNIIRNHNRYMSLSEVYGNRSKKLTDLGYGSYSEYLRSEEWAFIKKKIRERSGPKWNFCNVCASKSNLDVHHSTYEVIGDRNPGNSVKILCRECHGQLHELSKKDKNLNFYDAFRKLKSIKKEKGEVLFDDVYLKQFKK